MRTKLKMIFAFILLAGISACSSDDNSTIEDNDNSNEIEAADVKIEVSLKGMFKGYILIEQNDPEEGDVWEKYVSLKIGDYPDAHIREFYMDTTFIVEENFKTKDSYFGVSFWFVNDQAINNPEWRDWESSKISIITEREGIRETRLDTLFTKEKSAITHYEYIFQ